MKKRFLYLIQKKENHVKKLKYKIYKKFKLNNKNKIKFFLIKCDYLNFKKKFIFNIINTQKNSLFFTRGICYYSAKYKGNISNFLFKKNTFKFLLNYNFIPNMIKKTK